MLNFSKISGHLAKIYFFFYKKSSALSSWNHSCPKCLKSLLGLIHFFLYKKTFVQFSWPMKMCTLTTTFLLLVVSLFEDYRGYLQKMHKVIFHLYLLSSSNRTSQLPKPLHPNPPNLTLFLDFSFKLLTSNSACKKPENDRFCVYISVDIGGHG